MSDTHDTPTPADIQNPSAETAFLAAQIHAAADFPFHLRTREEEKRMASLWVVTITDIMALMLTFFVLLYTMSSPKESEWTEMKAAIGKELGKEYSPPKLLGPEEGINIEKVDFSKALDLGYLSILLRQSLEGRPHTERILLLNQGDALIVSMPDSLLFEAGKAEVGEEGRKTLFAMGEALGKIRNGIEVFGHADPRPLGEAAAQGGFKSNWELSLARAANVASIVKGTGYTRPIIVRGMSSARHDELPESLAADKRLDLSRRVDIVILKTTGVQVQRYSFDF